MTSWIHQAQRSAFDTLAAKLLAVHKYDLGTRRLRCEYYLQGLFYLFILEKSNVYTASIFNWIYCIANVFFLPTTASTLTLAGHYHGIVLKAVCSNLLQKTFRVHILPYFRYIHNLVSSKTLKTQFL